MLVRYYLILHLSHYIFQTIKGEETIETFCNINGGKPLQLVSEKFLSLSIDPAVLLAGLNLSDTSLLLAQHLSPAYIRIAGPSTRFVKFEDNDDKTDDSLSEDGNSVVVTPSMWFGINEWLKLANLTPVFGINDAETTGGAWNPKSTLSLLEMSDKFNVSCYWILGFDSSGKNQMQYKQDLSTFQNVLASFPGRNESWKIVGSDISRIPMDETENILEELKDIATAVMWEPDSSEDYVPENVPNTKIIQSENSSVKVWTTAPKPTQPVSFSSALLWAKQVGDAAKSGYEVIFRQPRLHEMFSDTPVYWFSLLHKKLMGCHVLKVEPLTHHHGSSIFAHCARNQNKFERNGALTLMVVNNNMKSYKVKVKLGEVLSSRFIEIHSYILTTSSENFTDVFLNDKLLTPELLLENDPFEPEVHVKKSKPHLSLKVPPMSISFFVLPKAGVQICNEEKSESNVIRQQNDSDEIMPQSNEAILTLQSRGSFIRNPTLAELKDKMRKELEMDENFSQINLRQKLGALKQITQSDSAENKNDFMINKYGLKRPKLHEKPSKIDPMKKREELRKIMLERTQPHYKPDIDVELRSQSLDLTSEEIEQILKDRARARAARKNVILTNNELDIIVEAVRRKFLKPRFKRSNFAAINEKQRKSDSNRHLLLDPTCSSQETSTRQSTKECGKSKFRRSIRKPRDVNMKLLNLRSKLEENRQRLEDRRNDLVGNAQNLKDNLKDRLRNRNYQYRFKRDINMDLLKSKTEGQRPKTDKEVGKKQAKSFFKDKEEKEATIRKPGQTSDELLAELEEDESEEIPVPPKLEVYAELAIPQESDEEEQDFFNAIAKPKTISLFDRKSNLFSSAKSNNEVSKLRYRKNKDDPKEIDDPIEFLTTSDEFNDIEEDLPCIHEYFGPGSKKSDEMNQVGQTQRKLKKQNKENKKKVELSDESISDSMEYLRKKRNQVNSDKDPILELGEVDYDIHKSHATSKTYVSDSSKDESEMYDRVNMKKIDAENSRKCKNKNKADRAQMIPFSSASNERHTLVSDDQSVEELKKAKVDKEFSATLEGPIIRKQTEMNNLENESVKLKSRRKRDIIDQNEKVIEAGVKDNKSDHKIYLKQRLEELQQTLAKEKLKLQENKYKINKLREPKKNQKQTEIVKLDHRSLNTNDKTDKGRRSEVLEKLQLLRDKIKNKKKEAEEKLPNENKVNMPHDINRMDSVVLNPEAKIRLTQPKLESINNGIKNNPKNDDLTETHHVAEDQVPVKMVKRSLFDRGCDAFGNYKPITPDLKVWKPSDILSLKRDINFLTIPQLRPANDLQLYKNMITPNKYFNFRRRRSIRSNFNDLDNKIDSYLNDIEKDDTYVVPRSRKEENDYKIIIHEQGFKKDDQSIAAKLQNEVKSKIEDEKATLTSVVPTSTFSSNIGKEIKSAVDTAENITTVISRISENIQKVPTKEEQSIIDTIVTNISGFFTNIGKALQHYVKNIS